MRKLKFRAWDKLDKKFLWPWSRGFNIFGEVTCFDLIGQQLRDNMHDRETIFERMNDIEITQFTGLKDKNGKEIYEGDICIGLMDGGIDYTSIKFIVEYKKASFVDSYFHRPLMSEDQDLKIIGNVYENSELLEDKK